MNRLESISCLMLIILLPLFSQAKKSPEKFGKINKSDLQSTDCSIDSSANAYYIFDHGSVSFEYNASIGGSGTGWQVIYKRHCRIKILDSDATDWGNFEIRLHKNKTYEDKVNSIKGYTYNLEGSKIQKSKFDKKSIIKEEKSRYLDYVKVAMPSVKEGSVVELVYEIKSDFIRNINPWQFQYTIPVLTSDFYISVPEYFNYNEYITGSLHINKISEVSNGSVNLKSHVSAKDRSSGQEGQYYSGVSTNVINFRLDEHHYSLNNIPALRKESYVKTLKNYYSKVNFELSFTKFPQSPRRDYAMQWTDIDKDLLSSFKFLNNIKNKSFYNDGIELINAQNLQDLDKMAVAFEFIKSKFNWNGYNAVYMRDNLRKAYLDGEGNSADINLTLVSFMDKLGFAAYPVILSTRANGKVLLNQPSITNFNYVIAMVRHDGKEYLMDATDPGSEINILPIKCLNGQGRIIDKNLPGWIDLENRIGSKIQTVYQLKMDEDLVFNGKARYNHLQYAAFNKRKTLSKYSNNDDYIKELQENNEGLVINEFTIANQDKIGKNVTETLDITIEDQIEDAGDLVYFNPLLIQTRKSSPFKLDDRQYPVEFNHPFLYYDSFQIEIPEGYAIESLPKSFMVNLPDKSGTYKFNINAVGNKISVLSVFNIKRAVYFAEEYKALKEFYNLIITKQNEKVVLKAI